MCSQWALICLKFLFLVYDCIVLLILYDVAVLINQCNKQSFVVHAQPILFFSTWKSPQQRLYGTVVTWDMTLTYTKKTTGCIPQQLKSPKWGPFWTWLTLVLLDVQARQVCHSLCHMKLRHCKIAFPLCIGRSFVASNYISRKQHRPLIGKLFRTFLHNILHG